MRTGGDAFLYRWEEAEVAGGGNDDDNNDGDMGSAGTWTVVDEDGFKARRASVVGLRTGFS